MSKEWWPSGYAFGQGPVDMHSNSNAQSKPGTKMLDLEPYKEPRRRPELFMAGIVPF